jgi:hypothetical protein
VTLDTVSLIGLEDPIPFETLISVQLSLTHEDKDVAENPTIEVTELSTMPKLDPAKVTKYDPAAEPAAGLEDETEGAEYEKS